MATTRIYKVTNGAMVSLIEAASALQAIRHVVKGEYTATIPGAKEVALLVGQGTKVETTSVPE